MLPERERTHYFTPGGLSPHGQDGGQLSGVTLSLPWNEEEDIHWKRVTEAIKKETDLRGKGQKRVVTSSVVLEAYNLSTLGSSNQRISG